MSQGNFLFQFFFGNFPNYILEISFLKLGHNYEKNKFENLALVCHPEFNLEFI